MIHSNASKKVTQAYCIPTMLNKKETLNLVLASFEGLTRQGEIGC
ncbi:MAG: hypothetical protein AAFR24_10635 [Cyanobacteria bacterium J06627_3]